MKKIILLLAISLLYKSSVSQDTLVKYNGDNMLVKVTEINETEIKYKLYKFLDGPVYVENKGNIRIIKYANGSREIIEVPVIKKKEEDIDYAEAKKGKTKGNEKETTQPEETSTKIEDLGTAYFYKGNKITETELHEMLMHTKNRKIMTLVDKANKAGKMKYVAFGAIPLGLASMVAVPYWIGYAYNYNNNVNVDRFTKKERDKYAVIAALCVVGTIACPVTSGIYSGKRKILNKEAIKLYNQKY